MKPTPPKRRPTSAPRKASTITAMRAVLGNWMCGSDRTESVSAAINPTLDGLRQKSSHGQSSDPLGPGMLRESDGPRSGVEGRTPCPSDFSGFLAAGDDLLSGQKST